MPIARLELTHLPYSGVAVGSSIGHAIGGLFSGGGSSAAPVEDQQAPPSQAQPMDSGLWSGSTANYSAEPAACETDIRNFRSCMDEQQGNISICGWYLDQLVCSVFTLFLRLKKKKKKSGMYISLTTLQKACQAAAKPY